MVNKEQKSEKYNLVKYKRVLYNEPGIMIYEEWEGGYGFEIHNKIFTNDIVEAVSYLMRYEKFENENFWALTLTNINLMHTNPMNSLYWLSGGDEFWNNNEWGLTWKDCCQGILARFKDVVLYASLGNTFLDVKNNIRKELNLDEFYEYILEKTLI